MSIAIEGMTPLLAVFDMPVAVAFYRDIVGFEVVATSDPLSFATDDYNWAMLRRHGAELMLNTAYEAEHRPPAPDPERIAAHADTILYIGCSNLDEACAHLRKHGISAPDPRTAPYGMRQIHITDPDGYGVCFQWPVGPENGR